MAEDKNMLESLVKVEDMFTVGLIPSRNLRHLSKIERANEESAMQEYMQNFLSFLNTNDPNTSIQPLIRYLFKIKVDENDIN